MKREEAVTKKEKESDKKEASLNKWELELVDKVGGSTC